jgi:hypothetical protein
MFILHNNFVLEEEKHSFFHVAIEIWWFEKTNMMGFSLEWSPRIVIQKDDLWNVKLLF